MMDKTKGGHKLWLKSLFYFKLNSLNFHCISSIFTVKYFCHLDFFLHVQTQHYSIFVKVKFF